VADDISGEGTIFFLQTRTGIIAEKERHRSDYQYDHEKVRGKTGAAGQFGNFNLELS